MTCVSHGVSAPTYILAPSLHFFTGEVSLEINFCKVCCWSDQIWLPHATSFCRVQHHFSCFFCH